MYLQDQNYCEHCEADTMQTFHSVNNSYLPEWQCHACGQVVRSGEVMDDGVPRD